ncbi:L-serine ammonia-lyase, iron-sulfur-dependent subunit beta [Cohnella suwonensis]|uniref:L-serine deaminase n=1 Tax=Cohnella suwonensis TaxID=696072 RepID=A0ABW0LP51_9BACL
MRFKDVFSIIGPSMIGPSSSHTAGAVRLGRTARQALGTAPFEADIHLYGSFADTYRGHGTDLALVAGLLDFDTDDARIRNALVVATEAGVTVRFHPERPPVAHPNTATIALRRGEEGIRVTGRSIGGGNIEIVGIDRFDVKFTANYPTLLVFHGDRAGMIAEVTDVLMRAQVNISHMEVDRESRNGEALTVIECDQPIPSAELNRIGRLPNVSKVRVINLSETSSYADTEASPGGVDRQP